MGAILGDFLRRGITLFRFGGRGFWWPSFALYYPSWRPFLFSAALKRRLFVNGFLLFFAAVAALFLFACFYRQLQGSWSYSCLAWSCSNAVCFDFIWAQVLLKAFFSSFSVSTRPSRFSSSRQGLRFLFQRIDGIIQLCLEFAE